MNQGGLGLESILIITQAMLTTLDPDAVLQTLVQKATELEGVGACAVVKYHPEDSSLRIRCSSGLSEEYVRSAFPRLNSAHSASARAYRNQDVYVVNVENQSVTLVSSHEVEVVQAPDWTARIAREGFVGIVAAPMTASTGPLGVVLLFFRERLIPVEHLVSACSTLANLAALALTNATLFSAQVVATREAEEQKRILSESLQIHEWLVQTVLEKNGLEAVADALSKSAQAPVVIEDRDLNSLSVSMAGCPPSPRCDVTAGAGLASFARDDRVRTRLARIRGGRRAEIVPSLPEVGLTKTRVTAPVIAGHSLLGFVSILTGDRELGKLDFVLAEQGAVAIALEMMKRRVAFEVEQKIRGDFLHNLLTGRIESLDDIDATVVADTFDLRAVQRVLVMQPDTAGQAQPEKARPGGLRQMYDLAERLIMPLCPKSILIATSGDLTVLLGSDQEVPDGVARGLAEQLLSQIEEGAGDTTVLVGIGKSCRHPRELRGSYDEARKAIEVGAILGRRNAVLMSADLGIYGVVLRQNDLNELRAFVRRYVAPLVSYDSKRNSELVRTLRVYLGSNCHLNDTAEELFVHPHTVKYRLQQIEQLCGVSVQDLEGALNLRLALRLHDIIPPEPAPRYE